MTTLPKGLGDQLSQSPRVMSLWGFRACSWVTCRRSRSHPLPASCSPGGSPAPLSQVWGQDGAGPRGQVEVPVRKAGSRGRADRHQKPSLNKGWVGGGLAFPHPASPSACCAATTVSKAGRAWLGPRPLCCPSFCSSRAWHWPRGPAEVGRGTKGLGADRQDLTSCSAQSEGTAGAGGRLHGPCLGVRAPPRPA